MRDSRIANFWQTLGKHEKLPLMVGLGQGLWFTVMIIIIYAEAHRLTVFAVIMSNGAGSPLTLRLHLPTGLKLMLASIVNIVSLNSCHSGIIRNK